MQTKLAMGLALLLLSTAPQVHAEAPVGSNAALREMPPARAPAPSGAALGSKMEDELYAAREASSPDAKQYRGGDVIVISATTVAVILLVVLVLVLL